MSKLHELMVKGYALKTRVALLGAPLGNKNAAGPHDGYRKTGVPGSPSNRDPRRLDVIDPGKIGSVERNLLGQGFVHDEENQDFGERYRVAWKVRDPDLSKYKRTVSELKSLGFRAESRFKDPGGAHTNFEKVGFSHWIQVGYARGLTHVTFHRNPTPIT